MSEYQVPKHVHFCRAGTQTVFLDLKRDRYSAIDNTDASLLGELIVGWGDGAGAKRRDDVPGEREISSIIQCLVDEGLLTKNKNNGKKVESARIEPALIDLHREYGETPAINGAHVRRFVVSALSTFVMLRTHSLNHVVETVKKRKSGGDESVDKVEMDKTRDLALVYKAIRPFFFQGKDACLFDSLVLFEFLRSHGVYSTWIIGVATGPFRAHSWLQKGDAILNDRLIRVNMFTPILAI